MRTIRRARTVRTSNPLTVSFLQISNPRHRRTIYCHRLDDTGESWACHQKLHAPGHVYVRHVTEWFQKSLWKRVVRNAFQEKSVQKNVVANKMPGGRKRERRVVEQVVARVTSEKAPAPRVVAPVKSWAEENPSLAAMSPDTAVKLSQAPRPAIMFVDDEDDGSVSAMPSAPAQGVQTTSGPRKVISDREEMPGEYNPRAHPEKALGDPEDLVVFQDMVAANFIAQQRRNKLAQMRARQQGHSGISVSPTNPIATGFEPG